MSAKKSQSLEIEFGRSADGFPVARVGDAAFACNPIASQGLFNALSSALAAAGLLTSGEGLTAESAQAWSAAVLATFLQSELGRAKMIAPEFGR